MNLSHVRFRAPRTPRPEVLPARHLASAHTPQDAGVADCVAGLPAIVLARAGLDAGAYRAAPTLAARPGTLRVISLGCSFGAEVLRSDVAATLCRRIVAALAVGGVVVLGKAERPAASCRLRTLAHCVHQFDGR